MSADEDKNTSYRNNQGMDDAPERGGRDFNSDRGGFKGRGKGFFRRKVCKFCTQNLTVDYKNPDSLRRFVTERGKILPRRITGTCAKHQRVIAREIKRSRVLALMPFVKR